MLAIYKKEIRTYFTQMTGYIFLTFMILLTGLYYMAYCVLNHSPLYYQVLSGATILFFVMIPTLTMRLFSEEVRHKTDQLLFTCPLTVAKIVVGKFLAAVSLFLLGLVITILFPLMLSRFGELPVVQISGAYLGYFLMGVCFIAVGLFVSVLTDNQIIAAVATFAALFVFFIMDVIAQSMPADTVSSMVFVAALIVGVAFILFNSTRNIYAAVAFGVLGVSIAAILYMINHLIYDGVIVKSLLWFSVYSRYTNLVSGVLHLADIVFYITFAVVFIYLTINVIEKRRWR